MAKDYAATAKAVLREIGGEKNISALNHCATRLRFNLNDDSIPVDAEVKAIPGVMKKKKGFRENGALVSLIQIPVR